MKKTGILNAELSHVVASLGHGQMLVIGDAGLPVPPGVPCIDLAVRAGVPSFWDVLDTVLTEMEVERAIVATEASPEVMASFTPRLPTESVSHETLKSLTSDAIAVVRTGETVPYTNVVLVSGVVF
ncbi:MAG: D-ribose pyranase [Rhodobacteraceae bacterium]|nr:D-ribose pyranase [Paracoccaceae bacterium]